MQLVVLAYYLLLFGLADLIAGLIGAALVYWTARKRLTVIGAFICTPLGILGGIAALEGAEMLYAVLSR
jgi:hypothetical protein